MNDEGRFSGDMTSERAFNILKSTENEIQSLREQLARERELKIYLINVVQWFSDRYPIDAQDISVKELIKLAKYETSTDI